MLISFKSLKTLASYFMAAAVWFCPGLVLAQQAQGGDTRVFVTTQDAEGVTQASLNLEFLKLMESYVLERTRIKANEYLASIGKSDKKVKLTSQSTYFESGSKKLMVIRISDDAGMTSVMVAGIIGHEVKRVHCVKSTSGAPPISYGPCGDKISEVFGVKL